MLWTVLGLGVTSGAAQGATYDARVRWSATPNSAGYRVYVRATGSEFGTPIEAGQPTPGGDGSITFLVPDLDVRSDYVFAVSALGSDETESGLSNELPIGYVQVAPVVDSDLDGLKDGAEDANLNKRVDGGETDPFLPDSDLDGVGDLLDTCERTPSGEPVANDGCGCSQRSCDDANACTNDACTGGVCQHAAVTNGTSCGDANACNGVETCQSGACVVTPAMNCDDGDACTTDSCSPSTGCGHAPIANCTRCTSASQCGDGNPCTADVCSGGRCMNTAVGNGVPCADGDACNGAETCQGGACVAGSAPTCDDGNVCTTDACSPGQGCTHAPIANCTACTSAAQCNDGQACTTDACVGGRCQSSPARNGTACSDGNPCNGAETCQEGACSAGSAPDCNDDDVCTTDACSPTSGCTHVTIAGCTACTKASQCEDGSACTLDTCSGGRCQRTAAPNGTSCADSDRCDGAETCRAGLCIPGTPVNCDDGNACTVDSCSSSGECKHEGIAGCCLQNEECADSDVCTLNERCEANRCVSDARVCPGTSCLDGVCNPTAGCTTAPKPDGVVCGNADACGASGVCTAGTCQPVGGAALVVGAETAPTEFAVSRFILRPAGKKTYDLTAEGTLQVPAVTELVPAGIDIQLSDDTGTVLYGVTIPGAALVPGRLDFNYKRARAVVPGLRKLQLRLAIDHVDVVLRASVPRVVGASVQVAGADGRSAGTAGKRLSWMMRLGPSCTRNADITCPSTRSSTRRCQ